MEELKVSLNSAGPEVTIRTGEALPVLPPKKLDITGDIFSVKNYLKVRNTCGIGLQEVAAETAVVIVNEEDMTVILMMDPNNADGTTVKAQLTLHPDLQKFGINTVKLFNRAELVNLLKFARRHFPNQEEFTKLYEAYVKLNLTTTGQIKDEQDSRGNKDLQFKKTVSAQVPDKMIIEVPVFKGFDPVRFSVDICLDVSEASVQFWLESTELVDIMESGKKSILQDAIEGCEKFPIIYK